MYVRMETKRTVAWTLKGVPAILGVNCSVESSEQRFCQNRFLGAFAKL